MKINFSEINISVLEDLQEAYNRIISIFEAEEIKVYRPAYLNESVCAKDFSEIFNVYEDDIKYTFFVITSPWDEEKTNLILNSFSQPSKNSLVYFFSAHPLPEILLYLNKNTQASYFELEVIRNLKHIDNISNDNNLFSEYTNLLFNLSKKYFDIELSYDVPTTLKNLETILIEHFRNGDEYDFMDEISIDYTPYYSLLIFGIFLSELFIKNFGGVPIFDKDKDIEKLGISFSKNELQLEIDFVAHPIEKLFKFFLYGKNSSIINWYYEIKYLLNKK